jgi:hypothetical protein
MTNREFYQCLGQLLQKQNNNPLSLEQYLISLWSRASKYKTKPGLALDDFFKLLTDSFTPVAAQIGDRPIDEAANGFAGWDSIIRRQIQDLKAMQANGELEDEQRYFGLESPSGESWYNFDPCGYLECATEGSLGGWEEGDPTGRDYVPGNAAMLDQNDEVISVDPRAIDRTPMQIDFLSWDELKQFLWCGQQYE